MTLAIECSSPSGSVALVGGERAPRFWDFPCPRGRGNGLFAVLAHALLERPPLARVVVGTGPGSYNGLRMALSAAWGIAASRGAEWAGVPSLLGYGEPEYFVAGDARSGTWFLAHVAGGKFILPPILLSPGEARARIRFDVPVFATSPLEGLPEATTAAPRADLLATCDPTPGTPAPLYLKPPHITGPAGKVKD